jgi:hypothetical protein
MTRIILKALNSPLLVFFVAMGIAIQTSLFSSWPLNYLQPDIVLLATIWCGLRRNFIEGGMITLIVSDMAEIHSAAPQGLYLITYMAIYLLVRFSAKFFVISSLFSYALITLVSSLVGKLIGLLILYLLGTSFSQWQRTLTFLFLGAGTEAIFSLWIYQWVEKFDWITFKNARAERAIEDELQLDSEGF